MLGVPSGKPPWTCDGAPRSALFVGGVYARAMDVAFTDAELTELALAADPDLEIDDDAVPFGAEPVGASLLPTWYMPAPMSGGGRHRRRRAWIVVGVVAALVIVNGFGLCVTYGIPEVGDRVVSFW